ncbi:MAG: hypothetical protein EOO93_30815 [Pedobacter sp.]|nr:MAG: hypothetical protein EOO93_30815 [Pedobacter sp.]
MRINKIYAYIWIMKSRVNLTIEEELLSSAKTYAQKQHTSVSELVENFFKTLNRPAKRKNLIDLVEKLDAPIFDVNTDLKDLYHQEQAKKYGF